MTDKLAVIRHIIETHHTLRENVLTLGGSMSDLEALFMIRGEYADWSQTSLDELVHKRNRLQESLTLLEDRLTKHFAYEEETLPDILGNAMFKGLVFEHNRMRKDLAEAKKIVTETQIDSANRENIALFKTRLQQLLDTLGRQIESHATREEVVLDFAREGLEYENF